MLSKILSGEAGKAAAVLNWPSAGGGPAAAMPVLSTVPVADPAQAARDAARHAEAEKQAERRIRESREAGRREGEAAGRAQAAAAMQPVIDRLAAAIQEIAGVRPQILRDSTCELIHLSIGIARRILHRELTVDPAALEGLVGGVLAKAANHEICRVRIHPELEPALKAALASHGRAVPMIADASLARGSVIIETSRGKLDASLETQLTEIARGLADRLPEK